MKKAVEVEKKKIEKENKAQEKAKRKSQAMNIRRLVIINIQRVVEAFKEILSDPLTGSKASNNTVPNLTRPKASNNAISRLLRPDSSGSTPKSLFSVSTRLSNSQKKKAI